MQSVVILSCWVLGALQGAILILVPEIMVEGQLSALQLALPLSLGTFVFMYCSGQWGGFAGRCAARRRVGWNRGGEEEGDIINVNKIDGTNGKTVSRLHHHGCHDDTHAASGLDQDEPGGPENDWKATSFSAAESP